MEDFTGYLIGLYLEGPEIDTRASEVSLPVSDGRPQLSSLDGLPSPIPPPAPTHSGLEL
jgi:hypothetical protein